MAGCTVVGHEKVEGWPELEIREHYVAHSVMRDKCAKYVGFGMSPEACAEFNLVAGTCDIWHSAEFPPDRRRSSTSGCTAEATITLAATC